jgi:outer membrane protein OmpA-like peptidoglycan-associated protein
VILTRSFLSRLSLSASLSLVIPFLVQGGALGIQGTPLGVPDPPTVLSVAQVNPQPTPPDVSSDTVVTWKAAVDGGGNLIDGKASITGYVATVMSGVNFDIPIAASCSVPPVNTVPATIFACTLTGLAYGKTYKVQVVTNNVVGSSLRGLSASFTTPARIQTITMSPPPGGKAFGDPAFQLTASSDSGLPVIWSASPSGICSVGATGIVVILAVGRCTISTLQDGAGSHYASSSAAVDFPISATPSATATGATGVQGTSATLNALVPYPGTNATPTFCLSTTNPILGCAAPSGIAIGASTPSLVTASSSTSVEAVASGLQSGTTYYYRVKVSAGATTVFSATTATFQTLVAPVLIPSGGPPVTGSGSRSGIVGQPLNLTFSATSGSGVYSNWSASSLPTGLVFTPGTSTATVSGIPSLAGDFTSVISVTDDLGITTTMVISFSITDPARPTPTPTPTPIGTPTPTPTPGTIVARVNGALPAIVPIPNFSATSVVVIANGDPKSVRGVASATVLNGVLTITPITTFSGKLSLPLTVTTAGVRVELVVELTVNPAAVSTLIQVPKSAMATSVTWATSPNSIGYQVFVNGKLLCSTATTQCNIAQLLGPNSKIEVLAVGNDGTISLKTVAVYASVRPIEIGAVNFAVNKSMLDSAAKKSLLAFVAVMKAQGFTSISIVGHLDSKKPSSAAKALATARAKATLSFLAKYLKVTMKVVAQSSSDVISSNKTKAGQALNRRVALLINPTSTPQPTPTQSPTPSPISPGTILARVDGALPAIVPIPNFSSKSVVVVANGDPKSVKGVADATVLNGVLTITPISTFSGRLSLPVTVTTLGVPVDLTVQLTVYPAAVSTLIQAPSRATATSVTWATSPNAIGYQVFVNGKLLCLTATDQCNVPQLVGPKSKIEVVALGNDGTISLKTVAVYASVRPIEISAVNFAVNKSTLDTAATKTLLAFVAIIKTQGFTSITIVGHIDGKTASKATKALATARAKATLSFLSKYLKVTLKVTAQSTTDIIATNTTKTGQALNRRVALLIK